MILATISQNVPPSSTFGINVQEIVLDDRMTDLERLFYTDVYLDDDIDD
jgi:hypothetical protein